MLDNYFYYHQVFDTKVGGDISFWSPFILLPLLLLRNGDGSCFKFFS